MPTAAYTPHNGLCLESRMEKARQEKTKKRKQKKEILAARRAWKAKLRASAVSTPTTTSSIDQGEKMNRRSAGTQPVTRRRARIHASSDSDDEEARPNVRFATQLAADSDEDAGVNVISSRAVQDVLQFILVSAGSKGFVRDIELRKVLDNARKDVRDGIIGKVREKFDQIFGLKLYYDAEGQRFYLGSEMEISVIPPLTSDHIDPEVQTNLANEEYADGLLITALMFIFMTKRHIIEDEAGIQLETLRDFLRKVGDLSDEAFVTWFGPNRNADYLSHGWLSTHIVRDSNGDEVVYYDWGPRAETIVSKKKMLEFFCSVYGCEADDYPRHKAKAGEKVTQY